MNSLPSWIASCLASSVLPTPVGPVNRKQPAGRSGWPSPARERLIACATRCTASCWPNTTRCSDSSSVRSRSRSDDDACRAGMRAMRATTRSMSARVDDHGGPAGAGSAGSQDRLAAAGSAARRAA